MVSRGRFLPQMWQAVKRRPLVSATLALAGVIAVLGLLAIPFLGVPHHANAAKADVETAKAALLDGDFETAEAAVASARDHTDEVQGGVQGLGGDVWSWVPLAGGPVRDVRHLGNALDELVAVAETGVTVWPMATGDEATLYVDGEVDLSTLEELTAEARTALERLGEAEEQLEGIADSRVGVGTRLASLRDQALDEVTPLASSGKKVEPVLDVLPNILGATDDRKYILALLNPSELLPSGGNPQSYTTLSVSQGRLTIGETLDLATAPWIAEERYWRKVEGNPFHRGKLRLTTSTIAPDWSVSGEELANGWRSARGRRMSGVIAIDVVALADMVSVTGPVELPGLGRVTSDNLVEVLVGSYDRYPDNTERHEVNRALSQAFADRLMSGDPVKTGQVLGEAAQQRHFAVFFRNETEQAAFDGLGMTGRLGTPDRDYIGVFAQNRLGTKSDYWQRRSVRSDVEVAVDGSAQVTLRVEVHNDSPPYVQPVPDPRSGYFTRWNHLNLLTMHPEGSKVTARRLDGRPLDRRQGRFFDHVFQQQFIELAPQAKHVLEVDYEVPSVADLLDDGSLAYSLAIDPQGMVTPQEVSVRVRFPSGYELGALPDGWRSKGSVAIFETPALTESASFEVTAAP